MVGCRYNSSIVLANNTYLNILFAKQLCCTGFHWRLVRAYPLVRCRSSLIGLVRLIKWLNGASVVVIDRCGKLNWQSRLRIILNEKPRDSIPSRVFVGVVYQTGNKRTDYMKLCSPYSSITSDILWQSSPRRWCEAPTSQICQSRYTVVFWINSSLHELKHGKSDAKCMSYCLEANHAFGPTRKN